MSFVTSVVRPKQATPWSKVSSGLRSAIIAGSTLPLILASLVFITSGWDFIVVLLLVFLPLQVVGAGFAGYYGFGKRGILDGLLVVMTLFMTFFVLVLLISVLWSVVQGGFQAMSPHFFYQNNRYVAPTSDLSFGGVGHSILGTLLIVGLTTLITVPLGVLTAVYITETQGKSRGFIRTLLQAMSGLPSVVSGLFIYAALIASGFTQFVGYAGSLALVPLMLPTVARVAEESLRLVPKELRNGALALGAPSYKAFLMVTLPAARSGIVTAMLLGIARVIGETAPLLLTTFNANSTNVNILEGGMSTLPTYVYQNLNLGYDYALDRAWGAALVIMILVGIVFAAARLASNSTPSAKKGKK
ncbi:MAG: phosphate transporter permease PstA [Actinomycetota bacterium]|jgi:phosphate transport system permease protein